MLFSKISLASWSKLSPSTVRTVNYAVVKATSDAMCKAKDLMRSVKHDDVIMILTILAINTNICSRQ